MQTSRMILRSAVYSGVLFLLLSFNPSVLLAQSSPLRVRFLGPDDSTKLEIGAMTVGRGNDGALRLGVTCGGWSYKGTVAQYEGGNWTYYKASVDGIATWQFATALTALSYSPSGADVDLLAYEVFDTRTHETGTIAARYSNGILAGAVTTNRWVSRINSQFLFVDGTPPLTLAMTLGLSMSMDQGRTWITIDSTGNYPIASLRRFVNDSLELLRINGIHMESSADTGRTWMERSVLIDPQVGRSDQYPEILSANDGIYYAEAGFDFWSHRWQVLWYSEDGARTWKKAFSIQAYGAFAVDTSVAGCIYFATVDTLYWSRSHGERWEHTPLGIPGGDRIVALRKDPDSDALFAAAGTSGVYRIEGLPTAVQAVSAPPASVDMGDPYPNPARGEVFIPVALRNAGPVLVTITDALGRPVATVHDGVLPVGMQQLRWNSAGMAKGVYVVRLACEGQMRVRRLAIE